MVVNDLSYPEHPPLVVVLLDLAFDIFIYVRVRNQVDAYLVEDSSHFFIAAKEIAEYACTPEVYNVSGFVDEWIEEGYVRRDSIVIFKIRTHLVSYQVEELGSGWVIHYYWRQTKGSAIEFPIFLGEGYVSQASIVAGLQINSYCFKLLHVAKWILIFLVRVIFRTCGSAA